MSIHYDRIDVLKNRALCVDVRAVQFVHDWGPVPPSDTSRAAMRRYHEEREEWLQATGGKPYRIALNSVDAQAALQHPRYSRSATEREPVQIQPQTTGQVVVDLVAQSGGGAAFSGYWLLDITTGTKWVVFSCDRPAWIANGKGQFVETTPSAH
jgi:hypothetical protein